MGKIILWLEERIKRWTKPATSVMIIGHPFRFDSQSSRSCCRNRTVTSTTDRVEAINQAAAAKQP